MAKISQNTTAAILFKLLVSGAVLATSIPTSTPAQSQTLFEKLFPKAAERRRQRLQLRQRQLQPRVAAPIEKVKAPTFYRYKADVMKSYSFSKLASALADLQSEPSPKVWVENSAFPSSFDLVDGQQEIVVGTFEDQEPKFSFAEAKPYIGDVSLMTRADIAKTLRKHYTKNPEFIWVDSNGEANFNARAALAYMEKADAFGLHSEDYLVSVPVAEEDMQLKLKNAMKFELALSAKALLYAGDAQHGKINPDRISGYHDFPANKLKYGVLMAGLAEADIPMRFLSNAHPQSDAFDHLRNELAQLKGTKDKSKAIKIKSGTLLKPGMSSDQLPNVIAAIKQRGSKNLLTLHADTLATYSGGDVYGEDMVALVKGFQRENKLGPDGIVGRNTIAKLVGISSQSKIDRVLMAMERLRWHPTRLGKTHVFINQPAYRATYIENGAPKLSMRAIVGKKSNQTNFFHDTIETVVFNPYWGVPRSILVNEFLPKLRANPSYLDERGYELTDSRGVQVASAAVDWWNVGSTPPYDVRQTPGPSNALGEVKILFPNRHAIYMHDTPSRSLFKRSARALSHGCVRLHKPKEMAAAVLGSNVSYVQGRISAGKNYRQSVKNKIPVYVAYFTAWPNSKGEVGYYGDIYGRDKALMKAMAITRKAREAAITG